MPLSPLIAPHLPLLYVTHVSWANRLNCLSFLPILIVLCLLILFTVICGHPRFLVLLVISIMCSFLTIIQIFCGHFLSSESRRSMTFPLILFHNLCAQHDISLRFSCPNTSSKTGKSERKVRFINNVIRTLLFHAFIPCSLWPHALETSTYLLNILSSKFLGNSWNLYSFTNFWLFVLSPYLLF